MLDDIRNISNQFRYYPTIKKTVTSLFSKVQVKNIFWGGMGGSSLAVDLMNDYLYGDFQVPIIRDYFLPKNCTANDLIVVASFSGNTEEMVSLYEEAKKRKLNILVVANKGKLVELCQKDQTPLVSLPACVQPRCAIGYFFATLWAILNQFHPEKFSDQSIEDLIQFLDKNLVSLEKKSKLLAKSFYKKIPFLYSDTFLSGSLRIWKVKINENSKQHALYASVPEYNHNELMSINALPKNTLGIFFGHSLLSARNKQRLKITQKTFPFQTKWFDAVGKNRLEIIFYLNSLADFTSYYLALNYKIDPAPVPIIEKFKKKLGPYVGEKLGVD